MSDKWFDQQERALADDLDNGRIDPATFRKEMAALRREYREMAREAAEDAYDREMDR